MAQILIGRLPNLGVKMDKNVDREPPSEIGELTSLEGQRYLLD